MNVCCCTLPELNPKACDNCLNNPSRFKFNNPTIYDGMFRYMNPEEEDSWDKIMEELYEKGKILNLEKVEFDEN